MLFLMISIFSCFQILFDIFSYYAFLIINY